MWGDKRRYDSAIEYEVNKAEAALKELDFIINEAQKAREAQKRVGNGIAKYQNLRFEEVGKERLDERIDRLTRAAMMYGEQLAYVAVPRDDGKWNLYYGQFGGDEHMRRSIADTVNIIEGQFVALGEMMKVLKRAARKDRDEIKEK